LSAANYRVDSKKSQNADSSPTTEKSQQGIEEIINSYADPIIRKILNHRLNLYFNPLRKDLHQPEAEDLYQTVVLKLVARLNKSNLDLSRQDIDEIKGYVAAIAHNVCNDFLRMKYPERNRLKSKLRDLMRRTSGFSYWKSDDLFLCGYAKWTGGKESARAVEVLLELEENGSRVEAGKLTEFSGLPLISLVAKLFDRCEGPVDIERLVQIVAYLQGVKDYPKESIDADMGTVNQIAEQPGRFYEHLEAKEFLVRLWTELCELPLNQRKTFVLTSYDHHGKSLLHLLLREQVVTISQIYISLETTRDELIAIWDKLPMNISTAAKELGTSTHMIAKWRHRAMKRLTGIFQK
jgi:RNA polymerase sigma factor (sigma-70 family)